MDAVEVVFDSPSSHSYNPRAQISAEENSVSDLSATETGAAELNAPLRLEDLKPKMRLTGTVKKVELFGAFVDVGAERHGLVHISQLRPERVNNVSDVVKEGDRVTVWVKKVDPANGRLDLTMIEPLAVEWSELKRGQIYTGKVTKTEKFGAFVDIGAERPGLVHISEMATYRVRDVGEVVQAGNEVRVQVIGVNPRRKQIRLSMKAVEVAEREAEAEEPAEEEENLTTMQLAFRRAQQAAQQRRIDSSVAGPQRKSKDRSVQEELLNRTLANRRR
ncbi:MAG: S1 RNA-binding domain-containing protein [Anaerolineales bacterium]|nr:S1 RNA-binding domain-containing protein [Anaerolineales bacterium]